MALPHISLGVQSVDNGYLPFPAAIEQGIIDDPELLAAPLAVPPFVQIMSGRVPNAQRHAGLAQVGRPDQREIVAFDHAAIEVVDGGHKVLLIPNSKDSVDGEHFTEEGCISVTRRAGDLVIAAFITRNFWTAEAFRHQGHPVHALGDLMIIGFSGLHPFAITDVDSASGVVAATPLLTDHPIIT